MTPCNTVKTNHSTELEELGPNGHRVGYMENGDKVEWLPDQECPGEEIPTILLRNDNDILKAYNEFWEKLWWNRSVRRVEKAVSAQKSLPKSQRHAEIPGKQRIAEIEAKYGKENLVCDEFELGLLCGQLSALSWVLGSEWEGSSDT